MIRLLISWFYVATNLAASLVIVALILRSAPLEQQAAFFLFQGLFFVCSTVVSQTYALGVYQGRTEGWGLVALDALVFTFAYGFMVVVGQGAFELGERLLYAASILLFYRGAAGIAQVQFHSRNSARFLAVPILTAVARIASSFALAHLGQAPAVIFFASAALYFALPLAARLLARLSPTARAADAPEAPNVLVMLAFFLLSATTFQWERVLYALRDAPEALIATGVCMTLVLTPISTIFASIYRGHAETIFSGAGRERAWRHLLRFGGLFAGGAALYTGALMLAWPMLLAAFAPGVTIPALYPALLALAVVLDRLGNIQIFLDGGPKAYLGAAGTKVLLIGASCLVSWRIEAGMEQNYMIFVVACALYVGMITATKAR